MWQDLVTAHGVENPRYRRLRSQGRAEAAGDERSGEEVGQELTASLEHDFIGGRVGIGEMAAWQHQLTDIGQQGEQQASAEGGEDDRPWHVTFRVFGFLG
ncbi:hypothetical protein D3C76_941160 [compost metagenome]